MKYFKGLIFILIVAALAIGGIKLIKAKKLKEAKLEAAKTYKIVVDTMKLQNQKVELTLPYLATIKSDESVVIATKVAGRILQAPKTGKSVKKGDILVKIDNSDIKSKIEALNIGINSIKQNLVAKKMVLKNALETHRRTKELLDVKGASVEQYQNEEDKITLLKAAIASLKNSIDINRAKIKELENLLSYTTVKAPFNGVISKSLASIGDMAMPGKPLMFLEGVNNKYLLLTLPNDTKLDSVIYEGKSYPAISLKSTINGLEEYRASIDTIKQSIGSRVNIKVKVFDASAVYLPLNALLQIGDKSYIFEVVNDEAKPVLVKTLADGEEGYAIDKRYAGKEIVLAKPDIFLKLLAGVKIKTSSKGR